MMNTYRARAIGRLMTPWHTMPSYLLLFVTDRCEASCRHCFFWRKLNGATRELTFEEIDRLLSSMGTTLQVTITGGSPELRDDLSAILLAVQRRCHPQNITLCSNGNHPEALRDSLRRALDEEPGMALTVDISLDGLGDEHDRIRNLPGLFDRTVRSFHEVGRLRETFPNLRLGCGICVSGVNAATASATARWAIDHLNLDNLTPVLVRGEPRDPVAAVVDTSAFLHISQIVQSALESGAMRGYASLPVLVNAKDTVQKELIAAVAAGGISPVRCSALRETAVVYPDGTVPVCELVDESIGNLRDVNMDLRALWFSDTARTLHSNIQCNCWHQCFLSASMVKAPALWPRLVRSVARQAWGALSHG